MDIKQMHEALTSPPLKPTAIGGYPEAPMHIGQYRVQYLSPTQVSILDTETKEAGCFDAVALREAIIFAVGSFFGENF